MFGLKRRKKFEFKAEYNQGRFCDHLDVEDFFNELIGVIKQAPALNTEPKGKYLDEEYEFSISAIDGYKAKRINIPTKMKLKLELRGKRGEKSNLSLKVIADSPVKSIDEIRGYLDDYFNYSKICEVAKELHGSVNGD